MKMFLKILAVVIIPLGFSCSEKHLISDPSYRNLVEHQFAERKELAAARSEELFGVMDKSLSLRETEALTFLFAFMPLNDLADYNGEYFLGLVRTSLKARDETTWGPKIPEDIYLHYVLPYRVNNENLDSFRIAYYDEIMNRVKGLGMMDAALEINHWCHEKVSYQPADIRTSAPMSTILSARGRCGEESTFTVAALRTAGIPARQVYTPRWAHTDDNHAWVEVWSEGKWYYFGACEPEAVIDRGWFTEPARRAMLIHTKCFGVQDKENALNRLKYFTEINHLSKYAATKQICVKVTDTDGHPVNNARVEYQLYNYAEFYPIATVPADSSGLSRFETGLGDLLIWATDGKKFAYKKISVTETDTLELKLAESPGPEYAEDIDLQVPLALVPLPGPTPEQSEANSKRLESENEVRQKYIDSWIKPPEISELARNLNLDEGEVQKIFSRGMGNYRELRSFLLSVPDSLRQTALSMLSVLADKDLRDTRSSILSDHLLHCPSYTCSDGVDEGIYADYVLNPRIANEMLSGWRSQLLAALPGGLRSKAPGNPELIRTYLEETLKIDDAENYYKTPITPAGVLHLRVSDAFSRDICFVAICRTLGIPSRLEPGSLVPQYFLDREWHDLYFAGQAKPSGNRAYIRFASKETRPEPEYYTHFTIARFSNGRYNTLEYDYNMKISDQKGELPVVPGSYMLVTGNRLPDSRILTTLSFFNIAADEHRTIEIKLRKDPAGMPFLGKVDPETVKRSFSGIKTDKGFVLLFVEPEKEPSKHVFNDLAYLRKEFDNWGGPFVFIAAEEASWKGFSREELAKMPANTVCTSDKKLLSSLSATLPEGEARLPLVVLAAADGKILYRSAGYRIGTGEQILRYAP